ncbi:MAG TPA: rRNA maturation RNase YbeY [Bacteroidales bacterium]|nr:rRNA maturation RNase YbeY [Bacteroidales bacterium]
MSFFFHTDKINFKLQDTSLYKAWLKRIIAGYYKSPGTINFIFTSNDELLKINKVYLNHNYYTDVITFNFNRDDLIEGDIYISIDQVRINANLYSQNFTTELERIMVHGILHLIGFDDKEAQDKIVMTNEENRALKLLQGIKDEN